MLVFFLRNKINSTQQLLPKKVLYNYHQSILVFSSKYHLRSFQSIVYDFIDLTFFLCIKEFEAEHHIGHGDSKIYNVIVDSEPYENLDVKQKTRIDLRIGTFKNLKNNISKIAVKSVVYPVLMLLSFLS